ncbi:MAG: hypothetical protein WAK17_24390 [Candidatus Nitrosopolaris sp.]|jgi:hypothetical protein
MILSRHNSLYILPLFTLYTSVDGVYNDILSIEGLNALIFNDPYAKLCFTAMLASRCCLGRIHQESCHTFEKKVTYIDLDTTFSAYVRARLLLKQSTIATTETSISNPLIIEDIHKNIKIYLPIEGNFESILNEVIDSMSESCIVIFDSVNSFYNLYYKKINIESGFGLSNVNHLLSIFLMLLVKHGVTLQIPILATSMIRYKKSYHWIQSPSSNRLLRLKSVVKLYVEMINENDLSVHIISHPSRPREIVIFQNQGINL